MKRRLYTIIISCFTLFFSYSCSSDGDSESVDSIYLDYSSNNDIKADGDSEEFLRAKLRINKDVFNDLNEKRIKNISKGDTYSINYVKREGDFIQVNLSYSGGCKNHDFEVIWDGVVYTDEPCHMNLMLVHDANDDLCEAYITETIVINLEALIGDVDYKDTCSYNIFSTYNSGDNADAIVKGMN